MLLTGAGGSPENLVRDEIAQSTARRPSAPMAPPSFFSAAAAGGGEGFFFLPFEGVGGPISGLWLPVASRGLDSQRLLQALGSCGLSIYGQGVTRALQGL